jgi:hypothetical protein
MDKRTAAERLLEIADAIEKEAFDSTYFICDKCNHTATLATINGRRHKAASELNVQNVNVVTVNEKVACPACEGVMTYAATDESRKYWIESADDTMLPSDEAPLPSEEDEENKDTDKAAPKTDPDALFQPVDEKKTDDILDTELGDSPKAPDEEVPGGIGDAPEKKPADAPLEDTDMPPEDKGEKPTDDLPSNSEDMPPSDETPPVTEEEVPMNEEPVKKKPKKKDDVEFPKEDVPKFEKMPKDAAEAYSRSLAKYAL